jgi:lambda family phage holin
MFQEIQDAISGSHAFGGVVMAIIMSALRVLYDQKETTVIRIILESLICGAITVSAGSVFAALGYGQGWYLFCGGVIGLVGSQFVRRLAQSLIKDKLQGSDDE